MFYFHIQAIWKTQIGQLRGNVELQPPYAINVLTLRRNLANQYANVGFMSYVEPAVNRQPGFRRWTRRAFAEQTDESSVWTSVELQIKKMQNKTQ